MIDQKINVNLKDIIYDKDYYPREKWKTATIQKYTDDLKAGNKFPPIALEKNTNKLLDGMHRWKAYQQYLAEYQEVVAQPNFDQTHLDDWAIPSEKIEIEYHLIPDGIPPKLYAASLSKDHGDRISGADRKSIAREIYTDNADFTLKTLSAYLGGSISTNHNYISDILASRREEKKMLAYRLHMLGWTQDEIGKAVGLSQSNAREKLSEFSDMEKQIKNLILEGHPFTEIAERFNMPLQLVWAIHLAEKNDQDKMKALNIKTQPYDFWSFGNCHDLFGAKHPGRIPGQLIAHVLYFFTKPGDMIIDPMAGSGTILDVCLTMGRKCYAYDIDNRHERKDTIIYNLDKGWPERIKKANLIFWDPPYFKKMDSQTIGDNGYIKQSISKLDRDQYLSFFSNRLKEAKKLVKKGTILAFLMSDWNDNEDKKQGIFVWDYANLILKAGWTLKRHIQCPLSTQQVHPDTVNKFRISKKLARLERYFLIAKA